MAKLISPYESRIGKDRPKVGQTITVYGLDCTIIKVWPFGTVDCVSKDGNLAWRVTGLSFL
jgi:hypothetical protein